MKISVKNIFFYLGSRGLLNFLSDRFYLKIAYRLCFHKKLNLEKPVTYNEKLQWLKLYNRDASYCNLVDKYAVRDYVSNLIGDEYLIPLIGGPWYSFNEIDFESLPNEFVLKCNHDSGGLVICKDKSALDYEKAKKKINKSMRRNFYNGNKEWPYKDVKPCIIAEKYMVDESGSELKDYKFFCFDGQPKFMFIASGRNSGKTTFDFFDMDFNRLDIKNGHLNSTIPYQKPKNLEKMKMLACKLSAGLIHARIDFYDVNGKIYFGEITFFHWSGFVPFEPEKWDVIFGNCLKLNNCGGKE